METVSLVLKIVGIIIIVGILLFILRDIFTMEMKDFNKTLRIAIEKNSKGYYGVYQIMPHGEEYFIDRE